MTTSDPEDVGYLPPQFPDHTWVLYHLQGSEKHPGTTNMSSLYHRPLPLAQEIIRMWRSWNLWRGGSFDGTDGSGRRLALVYYGEHGAEVEPIDDLKALYDPKNPKDSTRRIRLAIESWRP